MSPEELAQRFHEAYERLAPSFGYETRKASAKPWAEVPAQNRLLMTAVTAEVMAPLLAEVERLEADHMKFVAEHNFGAFQRLQAERDAALADAARLRAALRRWAIVRWTDDDDGLLKDGIPTERCRSCGKVAVNHKPLGHAAKCDVDAALNAPAGNEALREFGRRVLFKSVECEADWNADRIVDAVLRGER